MIWIECSKEYRDAHPERKYGIRVGDEMRTLPSNVSVPDNTLLFTKPLCGCKELSRYRASFIKREKIDNDIDIIKEKFAEDAEAYNSVGGKAAPYTISSEDAVFTANQTVTIGVSNATKLNSTYKKAIAKEDHKIVYNLDNQYKGVISDIMSGYYGDKTVEDFLSELGGATVWKSRLKLTVNANIKVFRKYCDISEDEARELAYKLDKAIARNNILDFMGQLGIKSSIEDFAEELKEFIAFKEQQVVKTYIPTGGK